MRTMKMSGYRFGLLVMLSLPLGCAEVITERQGASLDIVPITNSYQITIKDERQAWQQLQTFVQQQWRVIANERVEIHWRSKRGRVMAEKLQQHLQTAGIGADQIELKGAKEALSGHFDLAFSLTRYQVIAPVCPYSQIGYFGAIEEGCAVESARWQSMIHPEKMLVDQKWQE